MKPLFSALDRAEAHLAKHASPFYFGENVTESDVRLYTTIARFDPVYVQHFKCNIRDIRSGYPALHKWLRNLYWNVPAFKNTTQFEHIKKHYTKSHKQINPYVSPFPGILISFGIQTNLAHVYICVSFPLCVQLMVCDS